MLKRYTFWFTAAILFQFLTGIIHSLTLFITPTGKDETGRRMIELVTTYDMGTGPLFHPTFYNLFTALSSCFTFLCIFAALTNGYLLLKNTDPGVMKGIIAINVAIFGTVFAVIAYFTFLPPIICSGLIFINLLAAYITVPKTATGA